VNSIYGLLLHRPEQLLEAAGQALYKTLQGLKETGQVQKVGASVYAPSELGELTPRYRFDLIQAPFNLVDRRLHTTGWLQRLKDEGVEIHTRSVFLQGLLLMPQATRPAKFASWSELWSKWHGWLSRHKVSAVRACLAFPLSFSEIDRVVVGADSVSQLEQIISAATITAPVDLPDLHCDVESLINPTRWSHL
jgi:aryl-alcohol dehydrogenase-like predicted oxidoreductase